MTEAEKSRLDALDAFLASAGWQLLREHAKAEWGPAAAWQKLESLSGDDRDRIARIKFTNEQVGALMDWPQQERDRLKRRAQTLEPSMSRGGYR